MAQEYSIPLSDTYISQFGKNSDLVGFNPVFKLNSKTLSNRSLSAELKKLPTNIPLKNPAYFFLHFSGVKNSVFVNEVTVLMDDYLSDTPILFIDSNGNLDFTDDGAPVSLINESLVKLKNSEDNSGKLHYQLARSKVSSENAPRIESRYAAQFPKNELIPANLWVTNQRLSANASYAKLGEKPITVLLLDSNADGIYSFSPDEGGDRISVVENHPSLNQDLSEYFRAAEPIDHNAVFTLFGKNYRFKQLNSTELQLASTDLDPKVFFKKGENISSFEIELLDGKKIKLGDLLDGKKNLLIDVGGTWCGGCIAQEPTIKALKTKGLVNVIGVFGNDTKERVQRYVQKHELDWPVALMSDSFKEKFRVSMFPTYILVSPFGRIESVEINAEKLAGILRLEK